MKLVRFVLSGFTLIILFYSISSAQEKVYWDVVSRIREEGFERSKVMEYVWYLTDVFGPRFTASPNMRDAQNWLKTTMDEIGLVNTALEPWGESFVSWDIEYISIHMLEPEDLKINAVIMASFAYHSAMRDDKMPRKTMNDNE